MPDAILEPKSACMDDFLSVENLELADAAVTEIFKMMLGFDVVVELPNPSLSSPEPDERTAIVGYSGCMRGSCQVCIDTPAAQSIASAMLGGAPIDDQDDSLNDAVGELCNMLAGGWKNSVPGLASECALSPPTVISGRDYKVHMTKPSVKLSRAYRFGDHKFYLTLSREEIGTP